VQILDLALHKTGEVIPSFFTDEAKKAYAELRGELKPDNSRPKLHLRRSAAHGHDSTGGRVGKSAGGVAGGSDSLPTSFPPITMLLKPKDQSKMKQLANLRQRQNNPADASKVTDLSDLAVSEQALEKAIVKLRQTSQETGVNLNTKTL
jgi:hypothetical protein